MVFINEKFVYLTLIAFSLMFLMNCNKETNSNYSGSNKETIRISVQIPYNELPSPIVKSVQTPQESEINEIQVLVFENGLYRYRANGENILQSNGSASFLARLRPSNVPTTLYLIANNNSIINANELEYNTPIDEVNTLFNLLNTTAVIRGNTALWGSYTLENGIHNTLEDITEPISLLRAVARVDVELASNVTNFTLETIQVFRGSSLIQIIPNSSTSGSPITSPSIPSNNQNTINTNVINTSSTRFSRAQIYLPESAAPTLANQTSQATCIVIGGRINNVTRFFRLDFNPQVSGHPLGQVLRNNRYVFTITNIVAGSHTTALAAANAASSNTGVTLAVWPNDQVQHMFFDNTNFIGVSALEASLRGIIGSSSEINVATSVANYSIRFGTTDAWQQGNLNNGTFSVTRTNSNRTLLITALVNNFTNIRQQIMQIQSGTLTLNIQITQSREIPNLEWATRNIGGFRTFVTNIQDFGGFFQWDRTTSFPADGNQGTPAGWNSVLSATLNWPASNDPCPAGWRLPTNEDWAVFRTMFPAMSLRPTGSLASPGNGIWFAPTQAQADAATFASPGPAIFLPSSGWRNNTGQHAFGNNTAEFGFYWASNRTTTGFRVFQLGSGTGIIYAVSNTSAYSVRCVRDR